MKAVVWLFILASFELGFLPENHARASQSQNGSCDDDLSIVLVAHLKSAVETEIETFRPGQLQRIIDPRLDYLNTGLSPSEFDTPMGYVMAMEERAQFMRNRLENQGMVIKSALRIRIGLIAKITPFMTSLMESLETRDGEFTVLTQASLNEALPKILDDIKTAQSRSFVNSGLVDSAGRPILMMKNPL
jgi:hypothetical protein